MTGQPEVRMTYTEWLEQKRVWQESGLELAAKHCPTTKSDAHDTWLACTCGWQSGPGKGWKEMWGNHILSLEGESGRESARKLIAEARLEEARWWMANAENGTTGLEWRVSELAAALGASATDSASVTGALSGKSGSEPKKINGHTLLGDVAATVPSSTAPDAESGTQSTPETGAAAMQANGEGRLEELELIAALFANEIEHQKADWVNAWATVYKSRKKELERERVQAAREPGPACLVCGATATHFQNHDTEDEEPYCESCWMKDGSTRPGPASSESLHEALTYQVRRDDED